MKLRVMTILDEIIAGKREAMASVSTSERDTMRRRADDAGPSRDFVQALRDAAPMAVISEVKRASPSAGTIAEHFDPPVTAAKYAAGGAACISVLTDEKHFGGSMDDLVAVRAAVDVPVLRKDFVIDAYQVHEAKAAGADAVLLIAECLGQDDLRMLFEEAASVGMKSLIELYEERNLERVLELSPPLVGVNNRDLRTFTVDTGHSRRLRAKVPADVVFVSESGIRTGEETRELAADGVNAVLVGETLMKADDPAAKIAELSLRA